MFSNPQFRLLWVPVFLLGVALRFVDLGEAPMHADEAVGGKITADRLEGRGYAFDSSHYHGPTLTWLGAHLAGLSGKKTYAELDSYVLRSGPAICGALVVLLPIFLGRWLGQTGALLGGLFLATSPLLCMYSRTYIHEPVLAFFAVVAIACIAWWIHSKDVRAAICGGIALGFMAATKETFVIPALGWCAGLIVLWPLIRGRELRVAAVGAGLAFMTILIACYGNPLQFFATYFEYSTEAGHVKPWFYYAELLLLPKFHAPQWWTEAGIAVLALIGMWSGWARANPLVKVLAVSTLVQLVVYSMISYKTPWLMTVPWLQVCVLAGVGGAVLLRGATVGGWTAAFTLVAAIGGFQFHQARAAVFRFSADARNPMAFAPTSRNVDPLRERLRSLSEKSPAFRGSRVAVVGKAYWPLPWYLRGVGEVGYYDSLPPTPDLFGVVIAMPESVEEAARHLSNSHDMFFNGLRHEVPLTVFVRHDIRAEEISPQ